jgi:hypothetical protein
VDAPLRGDRDEVATVTIGEPLPWLGRISGSPMVEAVRTVAAATATDPPSIASTMPPPIAKGPRTTRRAFNPASPRRSRGISSNIHQPLTLYRRPRPFTAKT